MTQYDPTIEANYRKQISINDFPVMIDILDTSGQEDYSVLRDQYMRMGDGFLMVYSITNPASLQCLTALYSQALELTKTSPLFVLCGNKCDMEDERAVTTEEGEEMAEQLHASFFETSALDNVNVTEAFTKLVENLLEKKRQEDEKGSKKSRAKKNCVLL